MNPSVLVVIGQLELGGTERHLACTLPLLVKAGFRLTVFAFKPEGPLAAELVKHGIRVAGPGQRRRGWRGLLRAAYELRTLVRRERPDILHFFLPAAYLVGFFATWRCPAIRVMSRRGMATYQRRYPGVRLLERVLHRSMDAVLANSAAVARELLGEGVDPTRLGIIYNGVALASGGVDKSLARAALSLSQGALIMVTVANLIAYKGHADLISALSQLRDALPTDWMLCLVGRDDGVGESLKKQAVAEGIAAHVRFVGSVADVSPYLIAADIGVLPSHEEGFSNAILESMAVGLPMVVTAVGGNAEAIRDGEHGRVVPARNAAALAAALGELAGDPVKRRAWGSAARTRVEKQFGIEQCAASYAATYRRLLAGIEPLFTPVRSGTRNLGES